MKSFLLWDNVARFFIPFELVLIFKLILASFYTWYYLNSDYSVFTLLTSVIFSSPVSLVAFILLLNWTAHYFYLFFIMIICCPFLTLDAWKLFYLGLFSWVPLSLDFIELFMYIYICVVYLLGLLIKAEATFELKACLLIFITSRLYHLILIWQILWNSKHSISMDLNLKLRLLPTFVFSSICVIWPISVCIYLGLKIFTSFQTLALNTICSVSIILFLIHVNLGCLSIRVFLPTFLTNKVQKLVFILFNILELCIFLSVVLFASWNFYLSEASLSLIGYAQISSHVIFSTVFFVIVYLYEKLCPQLIEFLCSFYNKKNSASLPSNQAFKFTNLTNRCGLCLLPTFRAYFGTLSITHSPLLNCPHSFHQSCANVCGLLSLPCLQCEPSQSHCCPPNRSNSGQLSNSYHSDSSLSSYPDSSAHSSSLFESSLSSSNTSIYDDKDINLNVYMGWNNRVVCDRAKNDDTQGHLFDQSIRSSSSSPSILNHSSLSLSQCDDNSLSDENQLAVNKIYT